MELGTFGAVLKFANDLEGCCITFYNKISDKTQGTLKTLLASFAEGSKKNQQLVEKTRRMNVAEMILEAITGLDSNAYNTDIQITDAISDNLKKSLELEEKATRFYTDASKRLSFLPDVKRVLEKLAKDHESRIAKLESINL